MDEVVRPGSIEITTSFVDMLGEPTNPSNVFLRVAYTTNGGVRQLDQIAMVRDGHTWRAHWSSAPADAGTCFWHISTAGVMPAADQGKFRVVANPAAPTLAGAGRIADSAAAAPKLISVKAIPTLRRISR